MVSHCHDMSRRWPTGGPRPGTMPRRSSEFGTSSWSERFPRWLVDPRRKPTKDITTFVFVSLQHPTSKLPFSEEITRIRTFEVTNALIPVGHLLIYMS